MSNIISAQGVVKTYGSGEAQTRALKGANLSISAGEVVAIMGHSGSGKSTLLHTLTGIIGLDEGSIVIDGQDIAKLGDKERTLLRRTSFGFVFQFSQLVPELTALDNVALPLLLNKVKKREAYARATDWLARVGLAERADHLSSALSGGEAQRIAIARALIINPKVVFADEPTGSLDSENSEKVMKLFIAAAKELGTTVVMVTHEPEIAAYADRIIRVADGVVVDGSGVVDPAMTPTFVGVPQDDGEADLVSLPRVAASEASVQARGPEEPQAPQVAQTTAMPAVAFAAPPAFAPQAPAQAPIQQ